VTDRPWGELSGGPRCKNCDQLIRQARQALAGPGKDELYWYHEATSTIWCSGWGDPKGTDQQAEAAP
jgi:hypothetical protein